MTKGTVITPALPHFLMVVGLGDTHHSPCKPRAHPLCNHAALSFKNPRFLWPPQERYLITISPFFVHFCFLQQSQALSRRAPNDFLSSFLFFSLAPWRCIENLCLFVCLSVLVCLFVCPKYQIFIFTNIQCRTPLKQKISAGYLDFDHVFNSLGLTDWSNKEIQQKRQSMGLLGQEEPTQRSSEAERPHQE